MKMYLYLLIGSLVTANGMATTEKSELDFSYIKNAFSLTEPSNPNPGHPGEMPPPPPPCVKANPSDSQKNQIRDAVMATERSKVWN